MRVRNPTLHLDGKRQESNDFQTAIRRATFFCCPKDDETANVLIAFSGEAPFRKWARSQGILDRYEHAQDLVTKARRQLKGGVKRELVEFQMARMQSETKRVDRILKAKGINIRKTTRSDLAKIKRLTSGHELFGGPIIGSGWIFDRVGTQGTYIYLASGVPYPYFGSFNDRAESGIVTWPQACSLYQHSRFRGTRMTFQGLRNTFYGFNNQASSGIVW
jgi:hypothetical protein